MSPAVPSILPLIDAFTTANAYEDRFFLQQRDESIHQDQSSDTTGVRATKTRRVLRQLGRPEEPVSPMHLSVQPDKDRLPDIAGNVYYSVPWPIPPVCPDAETNGIPEQYLLKNGCKYLVFKTH